jgi:glycerate kinase
MLEAMGVKFIDKNNEEIHNLCNEKLKDVEKVELNEFNELIASIQFEVLTDVSNPLLGPTGATYVFSPQKGAKVEELELLESNMKHFSEVVSSYFNNDQLHLIEGTGAAGGVGYALVSFMNAKLRKVVINNMLKKALSFSLTLFFIILKDCLSKRISFNVSTYKNLSLLMKNLLNLIIY